jgi:hypothetical protein
LRIGIVSNLFYRVFEYQHRLALFPFLFDVLDKIGFLSVVFRGFEGREILHGLIEVLLGEWHFKEKVGFVGHVVFVLFREEVDELDGLVHFTGFCHCAEELGGAEGFYAFVFEKFRDLSFHFNLVSRELFGGGVVQGKVFVAPNSALCQPVDEYHFVVDVKGTKTGKEVFEAVECGFHVVQYL